MGINFNLPYASYWKDFDWNMEVITIWNGWIQFIDYSGNEWITREDEEEE